MLQLATCKKIALNLKVKLFGPKSYELEWFLKIG